MSCEHFQAKDLIVLAEQTLLKQKINREQWKDLRFGYWENINIWDYKSIYTEITFRQNAWITTAIDRKKDPVSQDKLGIHRLN